MAEQAGESDKTASKNTSDVYVVPKIRAPCIDEHLVFDAKKK